MSYSVWLVYSLLVGLLYIFDGDRCQSNGVMVETRTGALNGFRIRTPTGKYVNAFLGIPYALPPLGNFRFRPPTDIDKWKGVLEAKKRSMSCVQVVPRYFVKPPEWLVPSANATSEDCLYLNVWVPNPQTKSLPVLVWIHGGGFSIGYGASPKYDGQILASEENVIVVTLNYRLSVFGFFYLGVDESPGNLGLMDQASALRWVKKNIASFGGDPDRITLFGESAGSAAVGYHLILPSSHDLFRRVIMESGTPLNVWASSDHELGLDISLKLAAKLGCLATLNYHYEDVLRCMRKIPANRLAHSARNLDHKRVAVTFTPVIDGSYIPDYPPKMLQLVPTDKDVIIGSNTGDGVFAIMAEHVLPFKPNAIVSNRNFVDFIYTLTDIPRNDKGRLAVDMIRFFYTNWTHPNEPLPMREQLVNFADDFFFNCGTNLMADYLTQNGNRVFRYWFDVRPSMTRFPKWVRSYHGFEMDFVFGLPLDPDESFKETEAEFSKSIMNHWAAFARNGNLQSFWPRYTTSEKKYLSIEPNFWAIKSGLRSQACALWNNFIPKLLSR